jgi:hypothetical protein
MPHLSDPSLRRIDDAYVQSLSSEALCNWSLRLLADWKEARERLKQDPTNRSRPPSSRAPWESITATSDDEADAEADEDIPKDPLTEQASRKTGDDPTAASAERAAAGATADAGLPTSVTGKPKRKPGQQPGAPGVGRTQVLAAKDIQIHRPTVCAGCVRALSEADPVGVYTGFQSVDLLWGEAGAPGMRL